MMFEVKLNHSIGHESNYTSYSYTVGSAFVHFEQDRETGAIYDITVEDKHISYPFYLTVETIGKNRLHIPYPSSVRIQINYNTEGSADDCIERLNELQKELDYFKELSESIMSIFEAGIHRDILENYLKG